MTSGSISLPSPQPPIALLLQDYTSISFSGTLLAEIRSNSDTQESKDATKFTGANNMKKVIVSAVLISGLAAAGIASANYYGHGGNGWHNNPGHGYTATQQIDPAIQGELDKFYQETQDLRKEIAIKQTEKRALLQSSNPDPKEVSRVTGELFDLHNEIVQIAKAAGVDNYIGGHKRKGGMHHGGMHMGNGHHYYIK